MSRRLTGTSHLGPPPGHARHSTGQSSRKLTGHALSRDTRLTWVPLGRGGWWVLAQNGSGGTS